MSAHEDSSKIDAKLEQQGLAFLHQARRVRDLDPARVERIARRLRQPGARPRRGLLWPALVAIALVLGVGTTLAVAQGGLCRLPVVGVLFSPAKTSTPPEPRRARARALPSRPGLADQSPPASSPRAEPSTAPAPAAPLPASAPTLSHPGPAPSPTVMPAPSRRERKVALRDARSYPGAGEQARPAESAPRAEPAEDAIVAESRVFAAVIESWRRRRDAASSLALLDAYEQRHPTGYMRVEARALRAEIYLAQGRDDAALAVLDVISLSGLPRARELETVRGELRVKAGRCREARADLGSVLEASMTDTLARRATRALAHCP